MAVDWVRYRSDDEDSGRWARLPLRPGDIVISTRSKSGTTWMQLICALLVLRTPELPEPLGRLSPWLDRTTRPIDEVVARLEAQTHRRIIKTHTPLDGVPLDPRAHYLVVARHPLDLAVSLYHQGDNIDRRRLAELTGTEYRPGSPRPPGGEWLRRWIAWDGPVADNLDSLPGVAHHLGDAWRRRDDGNVTLVRYEDLLADLPGRMVELGARLDLPIEPDEAAELAAAASFGAMQARAAELVPDSSGVLKDSSRFFRRGRSGAGAELLGQDDLDAYHARISQLAPPDLVAWIHAPGRPTGR